MPYTDGVTEAANAEGAFFGETRLAELAGRHGPNHDDLPQALLEAVREFEAGAHQTDDITCVATRFLGSESTSWNVNARECRSRAGG